MSFHAKWGTDNEYGDVNRLYGAGTETLTGYCQWILLIDWDNNGSFNYNEGQYMIDCQTNRGERFLVRPDGNGFETMRPGEGQITLLNKDSRFDPDYAAGPLYGKILPGRKFRLMVKNIATGVRYNIMAGIITDIPPISEKDTLQLSIRESLALLDRNISLTPIYKDTVHNSIDRMLSAAKFPGLFGTSIDAETLPITSFNVDNINALTTMEELASACLGTIFSDNQGKVKFYSLAHNSWTTVDIDQATCEKAIRRSQPWENVRNIIQVTANKKVKAREEIIWESNTPIQVAAYSATTIIAKYSEAIDIRLYSETANSAADGSGIDRTPNERVTLTVYPESIRIRLINDYSATIYWTKIQIAGHYVKDKPIRADSEDATSISTYGEMVLDMNSPWLQDYNHAAAYSALILAFLKDPKRTIELQIRQRPALQYSFDLLDKIHFTSAKLAIDETLYVGRIEHRWEIETGQSVMTTVVLRPRLGSTNAISNDPADPNLPYIPPETGGGDTGNNPPGGVCLTDPYAVANGPWPMSGPFPVELRSNGTTSWDGPVNSDWYTRGGTSFAQSYIQIIGDWQYHTDNGDQWYGEDSASNWNVYLNGTLAGVKDAIMDSGSGTRTVRFYPGVPTSINSLKFEITNTTGFSVTGLLAYDTLLGNDSDGVLITGLTPGNYYAVDTEGGPWWSGISWEYSYYLWDTPFTVATPILFTEALDSNHNRYYFQAAATTVTIRVGDNNFGDNSGSLIFNVRSATNGDSNLHRWVIRGVNLFSICTL